MAKELVRGGGLGNGHKERILAEMNSITMRKRREEEWPF